MSDHIETYCGRDVSHVETFGVMSVYTLPSYRSMGCPKYIVFHQNGKALEEFRTKHEALNWARANRIADPIYLTVRHLRDEHRLKVNVDYCWMFKQDELHILCNEVWDDMLREHFGNQAVIITTDGVLHQIINKE